MGEVPNEVRGELSEVKVKGGRGRLRYAGNCGMDTAGGLGVRCGVMRGSGGRGRGEVREAGGEKGAGRITFQMKTLSCSDQILRRGRLSTLRLLRAGPIT